MVDADSDHVQDDIHPLLRHDLKHHKKLTSVEQWVNVILGVSPEKLSEWTSLLRQKHILLDSIIEENMQVYRDRSREQDGYLPWSIIANRVVEVARDYISDLPAYKLDDLLFIRNDPTYVGGNGSYHAQCTPDIIISLETTLCSIQCCSETADLFVEGYAATRGISWDEIISCVGFKEGDSDRAFKIWEENVNALKPKTKKKTTRRGPKAKVKGPPFGGDSRRVHTSPMTPLVPDLQESSTGTKRKGEIASVPASKRLKTGEVQHSKAPVEDDTGDIIEQTAGHALELLANTSGTRSHCLQVIVDGSHFQLWYYDAGGMICSERICWVTEFEKFAAILVAFASLDLAAWGIGRIPNLTPPGSAPTFPLRSLKGYSLSMDLPTKDGPQSGSRKVKVILGEKIFTQYSLVGRRTTVYKINEFPDITANSLVLKMSMQATCHIPEHELLNDAQDKGVGNLPEVHMWTKEEEEWRLSHGIWGKLFPDNEGDKEYEDRCQRFIVFTEYEEIEPFISPANMHSVFAQLLQCLHDLRTKANILHRDISLSNLMCKTSKDSDSVTLILNDFDLAAYVSEDGSPVRGDQSEPRIGTLPFTAMDILENLTTKTHYLRHDLESVFWVALWCFVKLPHSKDENEEKRRRKMLLDWEQGGLEAVCNTKFKILREPATFASLAPTLEMKCYKRWITEFWCTINQGYDAIKAQQVAALYAPSSSEDEDEADEDNPFWTSGEGIVDQETLGGAITCDVIMGRLRKWEVRRTAKIENFVPFYR